MNNELINDICNIDSYNMECGNYYWDEMVRQHKWADKEYILKNLQMSGDWIRVEDMLDILRKHGII